MARGLRGAQGRRRHAGVIEKNEGQVSQWWVYIDAATGLITATRRNHHRETLTFGGRDELADRWPEDIVAAVMERAGTARRPDDSD